MREASGNQSAAASSSLVSGQAVENAFSNTGINVFNNDQLLTNFARAINNPQVPSEILKLHLKSDDLMTQLQKCWEHYKNHGEQSEFNQNDLESFLKNFCNAPIYQKDLIGVFVTLFFVSINVVKNLSEFIAEGKTKGIFHDTDLLILLEECVFSKKTQSFHLTPIRNMVLVEQYGAESEIVKQEFFARKMLYFLMLKSLSYKNILFRHTHLKHPVLARMHLISVMYEFTKKVYGEGLAVLMVDAFSSINHSMAQVAVPKTTYFLPTQNNPHPDISVVDATNLFFNITPERAGYLSLPLFIRHGVHPIMAAIRLQKRAELRDILPTDLEDHYEEETLKTFFGKSLVDVDAKKNTIENVLKALGRQAEVFVTYFSQKLAVNFEKIDSDPRVAQLMAAYSDFKGLKAIDLEHLSDDARSLREYILKEGSLDKQIHVTSKEGAAGIKASGKLAIRCSSEHLPPDRINAVYTTNEQSGVHDSRQNSEIKCSITPSPADFSDSILTPYMSNFNFSGLNQFAMRFKGRDAAFTEMTLSFLGSEDAEGKHYKILLATRHHSLNSETGLYEDAYHLEQFSAFDFFGRNVKEYSVFILCKILELIKGNCNDSFFDVLLEKIHEKSEDAPTILNQAIRLILNGNILAEGHFKDIELDKVTFSHHIWSQKLPTQVGRVIQNNCLIDETILNDPLYSDSIWQIALNSAIKFKNYKTIIQILKAKKITSAMVFNRLPNLYSLKRDPEYQEFLKALVECSLFFGSEDCCNILTLPDVSLHLALFDESEKKSILQSLVGQLRAYQSVPEKLKRNIIPALIDLVHLGFFEIFFKGNDQTFFDSILLPLEDNGIHVEMGQCRLNNDYGDIGHRYLAFLNTVIERSLYKNSIYHGAIPPLYFLTTLLIHRQFEAVKTCMQQENFYKNFLESSDFWTFRLFMIHFLKAFNSDPMREEMGSIFCRYLRFLSENKKLWPIFTEVLAAFSPNIDVEAKLLDSQNHNKGYFLCLKIISNNFGDFENLFFKIISYCVNLFNCQEQDIFKLNSRENLRDKTIDMSLVILQSLNAIYFGKLLNSGKKQLLLKESEEISKWDVPLSYSDNGKFFSDTNFISETLPYLLKYFFDKSYSLLTRVLKEELQQRKNPLSSELIHLIFVAKIDRIQQNKKGGDSVQKLNYFTVFLKIALIYHLLSIGDFDSILSHESECRTLCSALLLKDKKLDDKRVTALSDIFSGIIKSISVLPNLKEFLSRVLSPKKDLVFSEHENKIASLFLIFKPIYLENGEVYEEIIMYLRPKSVALLLPTVAIIYDYYKKSKFFKEKTTAFIFDRYQYDIHILHEIYQKYIKKEMHTNVNFLLDVAYALFSRTSFNLPGSVDIFKNYIKNLISSIPYGIYFVLLITYKLAFELGNLIPEDLFSECDSNMLLDSITNQTDIFGNNMLVLFIYRIILESKNRFNAPTTARIHDVQLQHLIILKRLLLALAKGCQCDLFLFLDKFSYPVIACLYDSNAQLLEKVIYFSKKNTVEFDSVTLFERSNLIIKIVNADPLNFKKKLSELMHFDEKSSMAKNALLLDLFDFLDSKSLASDSTFSVFSQFSTIFPIWSAEKNDYSALQDRDQKKHTKLLSKMNQKLDSTGKNDFSFHFYTFLMGLLFVYQKQAEKIKQFFFGLFESGALVSKIQSALKDSEIYKGLPVSESEQRMIAENLELLVSQYQAQKSRSRKESSLFSPGQSAVQSVEVKKTKGKGKRKQAASSGSNATHLPGIFASSEQNKRARVGALPENSEACAASATSAFTAGSGGS